jgi:chitodextrinase
MNCRIEDCSVRGGDGGNGYNGGDPNFHGGHGGWPGYAFGGGLACLTDYYGNPSNPVVTNCTFINCRVFGGNGGDGGNGNADPPGNGGRGGGWYYGSDSFWYGTPWPYGPYDRYTRYSGKGGAVYVGPDCAPVFDHCTFTDNNSYSGTCGISGQDAGNAGRDKPAMPLVIENSGGAAYCDSGSSPKFTDCVFNNNTADINDPNYNDDPYVSFGGAVAFEDGAMPVFERCTFNGNLATIGGAIYSGAADARISDSNFVLNLAYHGAGFYCDNSDVTIEGCNIVGNIASVLAINAPNDMNNIEILGQGGGIYCNSASVRIADCNISANQADFSGGGICFSGVSTPLLTNCLLTDNMAGRDGGAVSANWFCELAVRNCTVLDNTVVRSGFDNSYGGGLYSSYGSTTSIINSIFWGNAADNGVQLGVGTGFEFYTNPSTLNVSYSDVQGMRLSVYVDQDCTLNWGSGNIGADPEFITGLLGDYYLSQTDTDDPNQITDSPCVDAGSDYASRFGLLMYTTRTDQIYDRGLVDMGYHYPLTETAPTCRFCDLGPNDGVIDIYDLAKFTSSWLSQECSDANQWCKGADFDLDTDVDFTDYAFFSQCWLTDSAPVPNPSLWAAVPYVTSGTASSMAAERAVAPWGEGVQYYFDCLSGPCHDSGWQDSNTYDDTGLAAETEYSYRVKARDEIGSETEWSDVAYIMTTEGADDTMPPTPDPMTWAEEPNATSTSSIAMAADAAYDISGVEYYFDCISGGCHDSGWQDSNTYEDIGLAPDTTYTYRVRARDLSLWHNATQWSVDANATTFPLGDTTPPDPPPVIIFDPNIPPVTMQYKVGEDWHHQIVATAIAADASGVGYYVAVCLDDPTLTSGQLQPVAGIVMYDVDVDWYGGSYSPEHQWQVFVYDIYNNGIGSQIVTVGGAPPL